jgi:hypothetical protein
VKYQKQGIGAHPAVSQHLTSTLLPGIRRPPGYVYKLTFCGCHQNYLRPGFYGSNPLREIAAKINHVAPRVLSASVVALLPIIQLMQIIYMLCDVSKRMRPKLGEAYVQADYIRIRTADLRLRFLPS